MFAPGKIIDDYEILAFLGKGGMAEVYKAKDIRSGQIVAIKIILIELLESPKFLKRFELEYRSLEKLDHENIVRFLKIGHFEDMPYLVMEYIPGGTLKKMIGSPHSVQKAASLLAPVARALEEAHKNEIVHRDVKPSNILLTENGSPKLSDFGVAKILNLDESLELTKTGFGVGTPEYMAPEQSQKDFDERVDIYALGVIFYELLTGVRPFSGETPFAVILAHNKQPLPDPREFNPELDTQTVNILKKALEKNPKNRYQNMGEFAKVLENLTTGKTLPEIEKEPSNSKKTEKKYWPLVFFPFIVLIACGVLMISGYFGLKNIPKKFPEIVLFSSKNTPEETSTIAVVRTLSPTHISTITKTVTPTKTPQPSLTPTQTPISFFRDYDIAFASDAEGDFHVYLSYSERMEEDVYPLAIPPEYETIWFPTFCGSKIAVEAIDWDFDFPQWIYIIDPETAEIDRYIPPSASNALAAPRCSADGNYLAFSNYDGKNYEMRIEDLSDDRLIYELFDEYRQARTSVTTGYASFSMDNSKILLMADPGQSQFYTVLQINDFNTTRSLGLGKYPALSPDGSQIAFLCNQERSLCAGTPGGSSKELVPLVSNLVRGKLMPLGTPTWSADGEWIYYSSSEGGDWDIFRIRPDGSEKENLTDQWKSNEILPMIRW